MYNVSKTSQPSLLLVPFILSSFSAFSSVFNSKACRVASILGRLNVRRLPVLGPLPSTDTSCQ